MAWLFGNPPALVDPSEALTGGRTPVLPDPGTHAVNGRPLHGELQETYPSVLIGIGCFWGAEKLMWNTPGVLVTSVGYAGGTTPNPTYREVCTGRTNHAEVVEVTYDPAQVSLEQIVATALEAHDPTQGFRQGNDVGTQYRSAFYTRGTDNNTAESRTAEQEAELIRGMVADYGEKLAQRGFGPVTTEVRPLAETDSGEYYLAEREHQQYLHKNPNGYCPVHSTGVACGVPGQEG